MFTEDLSALFDTASGFAVDATVKGAVIPVIFDRQYYAEQAEFADIISSKPAATCRTTDVAGVVQGDTISIGGVTYTVAVLMPDGTGITVLSLQV